MNLLLSSVDLGWNTQSVYMDLHLTNWRSWFFLAFIFSWLYLSIYLSICHRCVSVIYTLHLFIFINIYKLISYLFIYLSLLISSYIYLSIHFILCCFCFSRKLFLNTVVLDGLSADRVKRWFPLTIRSKR
jgi:hypothetical protein